MRILHTADWHIGDFPGPVIDGKNARAKDTLNCIDAMIEDAQHLSLDLIVIAGDVFHAARTWSDRGIREVEDAAERITALSRIAPTVVIRGTPNHDGHAHFEMLKQIFAEWPDVSIYTTPGVRPVHTKDNQLVNICALPGFDKGYWRATNPGIDVEDENVAFTSELEKLVIGMSAIRLKDSTAPQIPQILVGHYTVEGCNTESGQTMMFSQFEPVIYHRSLQTANYDLSLFGHIHRPQELGDKAFYSGAVNALNFNDERQPRGYYVHTLDGHNLVRSDFHGLPSRRFKTLRLNDEEIDVFNRFRTLPISGDEYEVINAVTRVLYDCTDEHNKAFNRAALEKRLYDAGTFWVQEITPENITVTVSKKALSSDNDPEANLRAYLVENGIEPADIENMMPLARDIIAGIVEKGRAAKPHGVFVPVEIAVTNYRNYRQETFNFEDVRFCTVNGQNGVGKSSLFMDAIYDALFEEPREGDLTGWICNDEKAKSGSIMFTFRIGEKMFRVSRTRMKSGKATLNLSELINGEWVNRSKDKTRDTQTEIERVIGMDGMTLRACALIMQDQYGLFLQADKESRMAILSDILGLGIYDEMAEVASAMASDTNRVVRELNARKEDIAKGTPDIEAVKLAISQETDEVNKLDNDIADKKKELDTETRALADCEAANNRAETLRDEIATIETKWKKHVNALSEVEKTLDDTHAVVVRETDIMDGIKRYNEAVAKQAEISEKKTEYDSLNSSAGRLDTERRGYVGMLDVLKNQRENCAKNIAKIDETLAVEDELRAAHDEYCKAEQEIKEAREKQQAYHDADKKLSTATYALNALCSEARSALNLRKSKIDDLKRRVDMITNSGCLAAETPTCNFLKDAVKAKSEIEDVIRENEELTAKAKAWVCEQEAVVTSLQAERDALVVPKEYISNLEKARQALAEKATAYLGIAKLREDREKEALVIKDIDERMDGITENLNSSAAVLQVIKGRIANMGNVIEAYVNITREVEELSKYVALEKELLVAKERFTTSDAQAKELRGEIAACNDQLFAKRSELAREKEIVSGISTIQNRVNELTGWITTQSVVRDRHISVRGGLEIKLQQACENAKTIDAITAEIDAESRNAAYCDTLKRAFGTNGIPHSIVRSVVPILEATASNILGQMTGGKMAVELVTEKVVKSNNKKEVVTLDIVISDADTGRLPYLSRSGGERVKVALSVILALAEVKSADVGVQIGFIAIDEPPFLDSQGVQSYCEAVENIQRRYADKKILIITHDREMAARFPQTIYVTKDEKGSHALLG